MQGLFITGTDTGVGKTYVSCALLRALAAQGLRTAAMKPVASGAEMTPAGLRNADALSLQQAASSERPYALVNPFVFSPPIAPHLAAAQAGAVIDLNSIARAYQQLCLGTDVIIVEGVGGWRVPLSDESSTVDLVCRLNLPVVMVVGLRLGCINHALLTAEVMQADGVQLAGWVANIIEQDVPCLEEMLVTLRERLSMPYLGRLDFGAVTFPSGEVALQKLLDSFTSHRA